MLGPKGPKVTSTIAQKPNRKPDSPLFCSGEAGWSCRRVSYEPLLWAPVGVGSMGPFLVHDKQLGMHLVQIRAPYSRPIVWIAAAWRLKGQEPTIFQPEVCIRETQLITDNLVTTI